MNMSLLEKVLLIIKYMFSSFLSIEMFIFSLLLFCILIFNIKRKSIVVNLATIGIYLGFLGGVVISYHTYVKACIDAFFKSIMSYIYFPSTLAYFFIILFVTIMLFKTVFSEKMTSFKRVINYIFFSILYFFFMSFVAVAAYDGVDLANTVELYKNEVVLSLVQISNLILVVWVVFTFFYKLYLFFKRKYDEKN